MAITKILAKNHRLDVAVNYAINKDKTDEQVLTYYQNCDPGVAYRQMMDTKRAVGKTDGRQGYHIIQSFVPGEITPELAMEIAREFAKEYLPGYQVVIGTHVDRAHIHNHIVFNSVNMDTGQKYHIDTQQYYTQIRAISDRLCREHGLSVIMSGEPSKAVSYVEWLRQSKGQPTYRSMLEADLKESIEDANDIGHFYMIMESKGYEIKHGNRLGFRLRGQEHFMYPERKDNRYSEEGIRNAIAGNLMDIEAGLKPAYVIRQPYVPYKKRPKYKGIVGLYYHYLYLLESIEKRQYPPRMTAHMRKTVMQFETLREQFRFLRENDITTQTEMDAYVAGQENKIKTLTKQRTILNVQKKKYQGLFEALADEQALLPAKQLYEDGCLGVEAEFSRYMDAVKLLDGCGISREEIASMKSDIYTKLADLNRDIRQARKNIKMCEEIQNRTPQMEKEIKRTEKTKEVKTYEPKQR